MLVQILAQLPAQAFDITTPRYISLGILHLRGQNRQQLRFGSDIALTQSQCLIKAQI